MMRLRQRSALDIGSEYVRLWQAGKVVVSPMQQLISQEFFSRLRKGEQKTVFSGGRTNDPQAMIELLHWFFQSQGSLRFPRLWASIAVGIRSDATTVEKNALIEVLFACGWNEVILAQNAIAIGIGSILPIWNDATHPVIITDIGASTAECCAITDGRILESILLPCPSQVVSLEVQDVLLADYGIRTSAEKVKRLGTTLYFDEQTGQVVSDLDAKHDKEISVLLEYTQSKFDRSIDLIQDFLELLSQKGVDRPTHQGILLCGGGSLIKGLSAILTARLGLPVFTLPGPSQLTISGLAQIIENKSSYSMYTERYVA